MCVYISTMTGLIAPTVELGGLTLRNLSFFSSALAAFSADNVAAVAMIQLENLGSMFLTSGKHAEKVPDLL